MTWILGLIVLAVFCGVFYILGYDSGLEEGEKRWLDGEVK